MGFLFFLVIVAVIGGAVYYSTVHGHKVESTAWASVAGHLGLGHRPGGPFNNDMAMWGEIRGVQLSVSPTSRGSGDSRERYTKFSLSYPAVGPRVVLRKQSAMSRFTRIFSSQEDLVIGSPGFDDRVLIEGDDPVAIDRFLSPARQSVALALLEREQFVTITNRSIELERRGRMSDPHELTATVRHLVDMALVMSAPTEVDLALEKQAAGDLDEAIGDLRAINDRFADAETPNTFTQMLEGEAVLATGDGAAAAEVFRSIPAGGELQAEQWLDVAEAHPVPPMPPPSEAGVASVPPVPASSVAAEPEMPTQPTIVGPTVEATIDDLLKSNRTGSETEDRFLERYAGAVVRWSGTVDGVRPYRYDSDFEGEGTRAVLTIGSLGDGVLITNRVQAVVQLPPDVGLRRGDELTVSGTLVRLDRYMRNFYLADAAVI